MLLTYLKKRYKFYVKMQKKKHSNKNIDEKVERTDTTWLQR